MTSVTRPRGPLPRRVYWFRRGLVGGVALLLVVGITQVLGGGSDGKDSKTPKAQTVAGTPTTAAPVATTPATVKKKKKKKKLAPVPTVAPLAAPSGPCDDSDVLVTPSGDGARAGGDVAVTLSISTKVAEACTFDVSSETVVLRITSGKDKIWSSQQCTKAIPSTSVVARRTVPASVVVIWHGHRSNDDCSLTAPWALPGYYHATAAALGSDPADVQFILAPPDRPTVTPTPKVKKKGKKRG